MEEMNFRSRMLVTVAICAVIFLGYFFLFPPPEVEEGAEEDGIAVDGETDGETGAKDGDEPGEPDEGEEAGAGEDGGEEGEEGGSGDPEDAPEATSDVVLVEHRIENGIIALDVTNESDGLVHGVEPLDEQFIKDGRGVNFLLLEEGDATVDLDFDKEDTDFRWRPARSEVVEMTETSFEIVRVTEAVEVRQRIELLEGWESKVSVTVKNLEDVEQGHRITLGSRLGEGEDKSRYDIHRALCGLVDDVEKSDIGDTDPEKSLLSCGSNNGFGAVVTHSGPVQWTAVDSNYFTHAIALEDGATSCEVSSTEDGRYLTNKLVAAKTTLGPGESRTYTYGMFIGAKEIDQLESFMAVEGVGLERVIDWGWFGAVSRFLGSSMLWLLRFFYSWTGIWGISIILLTIVVKGVTLPLTLKQYANMRKMRELQPEMEALKKKYADDKAKQSQEMQALFQRHGTSPLAGCFPMLVQFPVWIALYAMIRTVVELFNEPFLYLADLTKPDPFFAMPLAMGALMFVQTRLQPSVGDNEQAKMMRWMMPAFFTMMMLFLPSGLGLYIFANMCLSLVQSLIQLKPWKKTEEGGDAKTPTPSEKPKRSKR